MFRVALTLTLIASLFPTSARADGKPRLRTNLYVDVPVTVLATAGWLGSEFLLKKQLAPATCHWCDTDSQGNSNLNGLDRGVRNAVVWPKDSTGTADMFSNITAFGLVPLATLGGTAFAAYKDGESKQIGTDMLVIAEAVALAQDLNQIVKFNVGRERPFVHVLPADQKELTSAPDDNNLSFYSGHTTFTFALATAAGTVALMHGYKDGPAILASGLFLAALTGYFRIAADKHYFTDVITGAVLGSAMGVAIPLIFHQPEAPNAPSSPGTSHASLLSDGVGFAAVPQPGGASLGLSFRW